MKLSTARPLLNTYEDNLNISSSSLEGEMFKYNATKEMGCNPLMYPNIIKLINFLIHNSCIVVLDETEASVL